MRAVVQILPLRYDAGGDAGGLQGIHQGGGVLRARPIGDGGVQGILVAAAGDAGSVLRRGGPVRVAHRSAETLPLVVVSYGDGDVALVVRPAGRGSAGIDIVRHGPGIPIAAALRQPSLVRLIVQQGRPAGGDAGLENGRFHRSRFAGKPAAHQGGDDGGGLEYAGMVVGVGSVDYARRFVGQSGHQRDAGKMLHQDAE